MARELETCQLAERSLIKKYRKELWNPFIAAIKRYELIQSGDLSACSYQSCQGDAGLAVRTVAEFFNGEDIARVSFIGTDIINAENVESFLPCQW